MTDAAEPSPSPEEPKMEIHKPKPVHNWREFLKEYAIIVLGVLTALALEQAVEKWREHRQYQEAREAMRTELAANFARLARVDEVSVCANKRIAEVSSLLDMAEEHKAFDPPTWVGEASGFRSRYAAENEVNRSELFSPEEQQMFTSVYSYMHSIDTVQDHEREEWTRLQVLEGRSNVPPEMSAGLRDALVQARFDDLQRRRYLGFAKHFAEPLALEVTPMDASYWPEAWAECLPMNTDRQDALRRIRYPGSL